MKYIFSIGTEHQLFQVDIAIKHFNISVSEVVLAVENNHKSNGFIDEIQKSPDYGQVIVFESWTFRDIIKNPAKHNAFTTWCSSLDGADISFFYSHYSDDSTLLFLSKVRPSKSYLMDEGTASFRVVMQRRENSFKLKMKLALKSLLYGQYLKILPSITYFTQFDIDLPKEDGKELYRPEKKINEPLAIIDGELIYLGTSITELGIIDENIYLGFMRKIVTDNRGRISRFYYYSHRKESKSKLDKIVLMGFEIVELDEPFEKFFLKQKSIATLICSLSTTNILYNLVNTAVCHPDLLMYKINHDLLDNSKIIYDDIFAATTQKTKEIVVKEIVG